MIIHQYNTIPPFFRLRLSSNSSNIKSSSSETSSTKSPQNRVANKTANKKSSTTIEDELPKHQRLFSRSVNPLFDHNIGNESPPPAYSPRDNIHQSVEDLTRLNYKVNLATLKSTVQRNQSQRKVGLQRAKSKLSDYASAHRAVRELQS